MLLLSDRDPLRWARGRVPPLRGGFVYHLKNIDFNRPFHKKGHGYAVSFFVGSYFHFSLRQVNCPPNSHGAGAPPRFFIAIPSRLCYNTPQKIPRRFSL